MWKALQTLRRRLVVHSIAIALDEDDRRGQVLEFVRVAVHCDPEEFVRRRLAGPRHLFEKAETMNEPFAARVKNAFILPEVMGSDHCPVGIEIN